ncbi:MAG: hypothetical protein U5K81_02605 [Trueperaceae bacterium]|nr:hypothetical protein [Trueperaceae bacterium]
MRVRWLAIGVTFEPGRGAWRLRLLQRDVLRRERARSDAAGAAAHGREVPGKRGAFTELFEHLPDLVEKMTAAKQGEQTSGDSDG